MTPTKEQVLLDLLQQSDTAALTKLLEDMTAREIIHAVDHLSPEDRITLLHQLPNELAAEIMEEIPDYQAGTMISAIPVDEAAAIVEEMQSDEQADLMMEIEPMAAEKILASMDLETADEVRRLISYDENSAGGLMITEFIQISENKTVLETIQYLRQEQEVFSEYQVKYLYVVDKRESFQGVIQMHKLLLAAPDIKVGHFVSKASAVKVTDQLQDLINFFDKNDFFGVPVLDNGQRMVGVVLRKSVLEAASERDTNDYLETQGIIGGDELRSMPVWLRAKRRLSWLSVNILLNILAASVIAMHQDTLSQVIALAVFLPIISDMSGCSGNQAVAVSLRELSIGTVRPGELFRVARQEMSVGLINGFVLGLLMAAAAYLWQGNAYLGLVAGGALAINTVIAVCLGGTVPLFLKGLGVDPALASGPILTTVTDMVGFLLALTFAGAMLAYL